MVQTFKHVRDSDLPGSTEYLVMLTPMDQTCDKFRPGGDLAYSKVIINHMTVFSYIANLSTQEAGFRSLGNNWKFIATAVGS